MKRLLITLLIALPIFGSAQQWVIDLKGEMPCSRLTCCIAKDDGDIVAVGYCGESIEKRNPMFARISSDGDYQIHVVGDSLFGFHNQGLNFSGITRLNNGNYMTTVYIPVSLSDTVKFGVVVFDDDFEIVSSRLYVADTIAEDVYASHLLLDDDGTVVLCGSYEYTVIESSGYGHTFLRPLFYRFDEWGDSLSCRYVKRIPSEPGYSLEHFECNQIKRDPMSDGYIIFGNGTSSTGSVQYMNHNSVLFYDRDFNSRDTQFCPADENMKALFERMNSDTWLSDDRMLVYGETLYTSGPPGERWRLMLADISLDGTVNRYDRFYSIPDTSFNVGGMHWMSMVNDTTIYGSYYIYKDFKGPFDTRPGVCLFTKDMEILAVRTMSSAFIGCYPRDLVSLPDGSCVLLCARLGVSPYHYDAVVVKFSREDLNPIPCSVKEIPQEKLHAVAFPNPTRGELNIDISGLPNDTENRVSITDMQGMVRMSRIIRGNGNLLTIDTSSLEAGTYIYSVSDTEKELLKGKFVKE